MGNHTVNEKEKKEFIEGAAGRKDSTKTASIAWQNNRPQELKVEVTNGKEPKNLPFMIENGDLVAENDVYVATSAKNASREVFEEMKAKAEQNREESR